MGFLTVYSAAKAFVDFFSRGLDIEYGAKGIHVQCVMPLLVATKMSKVRRTSLTGIMFARLVTLFLCHL